MRLQKIPQARRKGLASLGLALGLCACQGPRAQAPPPLAIRSFVPANDTSGVKPNLPASQELAETRILDLASALRIGGASSLQVALAREELAAAEAQLDAAQVLLLPTLTVGGGYQDHSGALQETTGNILQVDRNSAYLRGGLIATVDLAQAFLEPTRASHQVEAASQSVRASINRNLTAIAMAHQDLHQAQALANQAQADTALAGELVELTEAFASAGQGLEADAARARAEFAQRARLESAAKQSLQMRSTHLATLLRLDPTSALRTAEDRLIPLALFGLESSLDELLLRAQESRPELRALQASLRAQEQTERKQRLSVLIPELNLGLHTGRLGGAPESSFHNFSDEDQFSATLTWSLRNLGLGESAARRNATAVTKSARLRLLIAQDKIAQEVTLAHLQIQAGQVQIAYAAQNVSEAAAALDLSLRRSRAAEGLPIEALQAIRANAQAKRAYLEAVATFNRSQFRLLQAVGSVP
jgi:outer membrane protein TolC